MNPHERLAPDDPQEWMRRARSNLTRARSRTPDVYLEDLCFDAQQAAEKSIKAVMIARNIDFPYVNNLAYLLSVLEETGETIPEDIRDAATLTRYASTTRAPYIGGPVSAQEYREAVTIAGAVVQWAETRL